MLENKTGHIYLLKKEDKIVYIGQSLHPQGRLNRHKKDKDFDSVEYMECEKELLVVIETFLIRHHKPKYNKKIINKSLTEIFISKLGIEYEYDIKCIKVLQEMKENRLKGYNNE